MGEGVQKFSDVLHCPLSESLHKLINLEGLWTLSFWFLWKCNHIGQIANRLHRKTQQCLGLSILLYFFLLGWGRIPLE